LAFIVRLVVGQSVTLIGGRHLAPSIAAGALSSDAQASHSLYDAISNRNMYPYPALPPLGGAGFTFTDPTFGSEMLRVTDATTRPDRGGRQWRSPSSSETSAWNTDGTRFYVVGEGGEILPYRFDAMTMAASRLGDTRNASGGLVLLLGGEPSFSFVDPDVMYSTDRTQIVSYRLGAATRTVLHDEQTCLPGVGAHGGRAISVTKDDQRVLDYTGGSGQDQDTYVYV